MPPRPSSRTTPAARCGHRTLTASLPVALLRALNQTAFDHRFLSRRKPHAPRRSPEHAHVRHVRTLWGTVRPTHTPSSDDRSCATAPPDRMECRQSRRRVSLTRLRTEQSEQQAARAFGRSDRCLFVCLRGGTMQSPLSSLQQKTSLTSSRWSSSRCRDAAPVRFVRTVR